MKTADETRTMDQLRADVATDVLLSGGGVAASDIGGVKVTTTLSTLAGLEEESGDLNGFGPVTAEIVRRVAEQSRRGRWEW